MCLILIAFQTHPEFELVVAANRDEFYQRPSLPAHFWPESPGILAGQDQLAGGTWLGLSQQGRFTAITNFRDGAGAGEGNANISDKKSRGELTRDFLASDTPPLAYAQQVMVDADHYRGFNLLIGDRESLVYCNNQTQDIQTLRPGIYGLSNHLLDTPWPKVINGKQALGKLLAQPAPLDSTDHTCLSESLFDILKDDAFAPDNQLPNTGIDLQRERELSPLFIRTVYYGTCNSTAIIMNKKSDGQSTAYFRERSFYQPQPTDVEFLIELKNRKMPGK